MLSKETLMSRSTNFSFLLSMLAACLGATSALADAGRREINQTCAVQTGCFPGDAPGFPVTITDSGSYRLTSNLNQIPASQDGLFLANSRITIDLNGFAIVGPSLGGTAAGNGKSRPGGV